MLPQKPLSMDKNTYSIREEWLNTITHGFGAVLSVVGMLFLVLKSEVLAELSSAYIYGASLVFLFSSSCIYHLASDPSKKAWLRKIDHIAIYLLIAGSYTPFLVLALDGVLAKVGLIVIWIIAFAGVIFKLTLGHKHPKISISTYAIMGWLALFLIYPIYQALPLSGFLWLLIGGLCYSAGIPLYLLKSHHYTHALWHICVVAGAACHFVAIYWFVF
jgi:hemolysin III